MLNFFKVVFQQKKDNKGFKKKLYFSQEKIKSEFYQKFCYIIIFYQLMQSIDLILTDYKDSIAKIIEKNEFFDFEVLTKFVEKVHLHIYFPHAFFALCCNFLLLTLIEQNQDKF